jgi:transcription termination factor Rho
MDGSQELIIGTFEAMERGPGKVRSAAANYQPRPQDPTVSPRVAAALGLRGGETLSVRNSGNGARMPSIERPEQVALVDGLSLDDRRERKPFDELTAIDPRERLAFETKGGPLSMRIVDLLTPIGLGQRGLLVAPPRTGKTVLLQQMAAGIAANRPEIYMMVLLIDERPEEVTDMRRTVRGEVVASSNDREVASHVRLARLMLEKAKRMVEVGRHVIVLLDSLTRVGRAFNAFIDGGRRIMSGGLDARALTEPKGIFGGARNCEDGGSLTILASCLIETGSRMDDVIFNEFKGTGNMEIVLSREPANRRVYPAIDLGQSGTRKEELLLPPDWLKASHEIRRKLLDQPPSRAIERLNEAMGRFPDNASFVKAYLDRPML